MELTIKHSLLALGIFLFLALAIPLSDAVPRPSPSSCQYTDVTPALLQRLNVSSIYPFEIKKLDFQHLTFLLYNLDTSSYELYLYSLGADKIFDTADDQAFLLEPHFTRNNVFTYDLSNGLILFWSNYESGKVSIKGCGVSSQGCSPIYTLATSVYPHPYQPLGMTYSSQQQRLYFFMAEYHNGIKIVSCALAPNAPDSCSKGIPSFTVHETNLDTFDTALPQIGFIYNKTDTTFVFSLATKSSVPLFPGVDIASAKSYAPSLFLTIVSTPTFNGSNVVVPRVVVIDALTGQQFAELETLSETSDSYLLDVDPLSIAAIYQPKASSSILGKRLGVTPSRKILTLPSSDYVEPQALLTDSSVLGILNADKIVLSTCKL